MTRRSTKWCPVLLSSFALGMLACGPGIPGADVNGASSALSVALPGRIQAEDYASGGEGAGFHDTTSKNLGMAYRQDAVDLEACADEGGGYDVGWTAAGEWLSYPATVQQAGTFTVVARVASQVSGSKTLHLEVDGVALATVSTSAADGWQRYSDLALGSVSLAAGAHRLRVVFETGHVNLNYLNVTRTVDTVRWGVSAVHPKPGQTWPDAYREQVIELGATSVFYYFTPGSRPTWNANLASIPSDHDILISTKVDDPAAIQAFVDQVPRTRTGLIYFHYWQEPEDNFPTAADQATYRARAKAMAAIVKSHPRMRFGVELMQWTLRPASGRDWKAWVIPEMDFIGWSVYCDNHGDGDRTGDGKAAVDLVADAMAADGRVWGAFAWGCPLNPASTTSTGRALRARWLRDSADELKAKRALNGLWFNTPWNDVDYTLQADSVLLDAWFQSTR